MWCHMLLLCSFNELFDKVLDYSLTFLNKLLWGQRCTRNNLYKQCAKINNWVFIIFINIDLIKTKAYMPKNNSNNTKKNSKPQNRLCEKIIKIDKYLKDRL